MSGANDLLLTHATRWAEKKKRPFDAGLIDTIVGMRSAYDQQQPGSWPAGSAEQLVLVRWPADGPQEVPEPGALADTLETWWRFLRGTGRMAAGSAEPSALVKELRRALPKMAEACADRATWSQGRVLSDFGASIGIDLSMSESQEELQDKLEQVMQAWNDLPTQERVQLMPDPSPKSSAGVRMTDLINSRGEGEEDEDDDGLDTRPGDPVISAREARACGLTQACLALADWVGERKEVTSIGVLRPVAAREAYEALDLFSWERAHAPMYTDRHAVQPTSEAEWDLLRQSAPHAWKSAADCEPLDRLWQACCVAELIDVHSTIAEATQQSPTSDREWRNLGLRLVFGLVTRDSRESRDVLMGALLIPLAAENGAIPVGAIIEWWLERKGFDRLVARRGQESARYYRDIYTDHVQRMLHAYDDAGLWIRADGWLTITEFGRDACHMLSGLMDSGWFDRR